MHNINNQLSYYVHFNQFNSHQVNSSIVPELNSSSASTSDESFTTREEHNNNEDMAYNITDFYYENTISYQDSSSSFKCLSENRNNFKSKRTESGTKATSINNKLETIISVEKRNARERYRVRAVNEAFVRLRRAIPSIALRTKRVSKVKTLQKALQYIMELEFILHSNHQPVYR